jgi:hypothetical protein
MVPIKTWLKKIVKYTLNSGFTDRVLSCKNYSLKTAVRSQEDLSYVLGWPFILPRPQCSNL